MEHWRGWLGLQHATETQAQAALGSLDLDAVGEPTLPMGTASSTPDMEQASLGPTLPWSPPQPGGNFGGAAQTTQVDLDPESADHSESQGSHRRRRAHAACD